MFQGHHSQQQKLHWSNWSGGRSNGHAVSDAPPKEASLLKDASSPRPPARPSRAAAEIQVMTAKVEEAAPPQPRHIPGLDFAATDNAAAKRSSASQKKKRKRKSTATKEGGSDNARPLPAAPVTILSRKQSLQTDSSTASGCGTPTVLLATPPSEAVEQRQEEEEVRKGLEFHYYTFIVPSWDNLIT